MAGRDLRKGFWRLAALVWAVGALTLLWWSDEARRWPVAGVCTPDIDPPYEECFDAEARRLAESASLPERLLGRFRQGWQGIDPERHVPRWRTARYREAVVGLAQRELGWALFVWGPFYLLSWAFAGFRQPDDSPSAD